MNPSLPVPKPIAQKEVKIDGVEIGVVCPRCQKQHKVKGYFDIQSEDIKRLNLPVDPKIKGDSILVCDNPGCNFAISLKPFLNQIESQTKRKVILN